MQAAWHLPSARHRGSAGRGSAWRPAVPGSKMAHACQDSTSPLEGMTSELSFHPGRPTAAMMQARGRVPAELVHAQRLRLWGQGKPARLAVLSPQASRYLSKPGLAELVPGFLIAPRLSQHRDLASG